ncbi:dihydrodipicolinate synthase family protein [Peribacillus frigoritolerans]|nr:dihydrodipicolinate synthase family protein [Peribacillus frigoritolerans]
MRRINMYKPFGMIPALPTPMNEDNSIDYKGLEQIIEHLIEGGMNCLFSGRKYWGILTNEHGRTKRSN